MAACLASKLNLNFNTSHSLEEIFSVARKSVTHAKRLGTALS